MWGLLFQARRSRPQAASRPRASPGTNRKQRPGRPRARGRRLRSSGPPAPAQSKALRPATAQAGGPPPTAARAGQAERGTASSRLAANVRADARRSTAAARFRRRPLGDADEHDVHVEMPPTTSDIAATEPSRSAMVARGGTLRLQHRRGRRHREVIIAVLDPVALAQQVANVVHSRLACRRD